MSRLTGENQGRLPASASGEGRGRYPIRERTNGSSTLPLLLAGLAVVGLGAMAWSYLGPDLRRYLKIRSM